MNINIEEYKKFVKSKLSSHYNSDEVTDTELNKILTNIFEYTDRLDKLKKVLYYNKEHNLQTTAEEKDKISPNENQQKVLHAAIGMVTESVEILDTVYNSILKGEDFDKVNIREEMGDTRFYESVLLDLLNIDHQSVYKTNMAKLDKRYGETFNQEGALNRDLDGEREILEKD